MHSRPAFSIRVKLLSAFGVGLVLMLVLGAFAISRLGNGELACQQAGGEGGPGDPERRSGNCPDEQVPQGRAPLRPCHTGRSGGVSRRQRRPRGRPHRHESDAAGLQARRASLQMQRTHSWLAAFQAAFNNYVAKTATFRALADKGQIQAAGAVVGTGPGDQAYDALKARGQGLERVQGNGRDCRGDVLQVRVTIRARP